MKEFALRLTKGQDLYNTVFEFCKQNNISAGVVLSGVGCVLQARIRDAGGKTIHTIEEPLEIGSLMGTVSFNRVHLHISLSKTDLSVIGGHLTEGTIVNTTCELVILQLENYKFEKEFDSITGYNELKITKTQQ